MEGGHTSDEAGAGMQRVGLMTGVGEPAEVGVVSGMKVGAIEVAVVSDGVPSLPGLQHRRPHSGLP
jgi:hypothetical protein